MSASGDEQEGAALPAPFRFVESLAELAGALAAILLAALASMMLAELAARNFFNESLHVTWELSANAMGGVIFLGAASALRHGDHVRVSLALELLGRRTARALDFVVTLLAIVIVCYITVALAGLTLRSWQGDVRSWSGFRIPLAIPQAILVVGALVLALQLAARAARLLLGLPPQPEKVDVV